MLRLRLIIENPYWKYFQKKSFSSSNKQYWKQFLKKQMIISPCIMENDTIVAEGN